MTTIRLEIELDEITHATVLNSIRANLRKFSNYELRRLGLTLPNGSSFTWSFVADVSESALVDAFYNTAALATVLRSKLTVLVP